MGPYQDWNLELTFRQKPLDIKSLGLFMDFTQGIHLPNRFHSSTFLIILMFYFPSAYSLFAFPSESLHSSEIFMCIMKNNYLSLAQSYLHLVVLIFAILCTFNFSYVVSSFSLTLWKILLKEWKELMMGINVEHVICRYFH